MSVVKSDFCFLLDFGNYQNVQILILQLQNFLLFAAFLPVIIKVVLAGVS